MLLLIISIFIFLLAMDIKKWYTYIISVLSIFIIFIFSIITLLFISDIVKLKTADDRIASYKEANQSIKDAGLVEELSDVFIYNIKEINRIQNEKSNEPVLRWWIYFGN